MPWIIRGAVREMAWSEVHEDLLQKISREMEAYQAQMFSLTSTEVYNRAEEIAAMSFCLNQLMENFHDYQATDLKPLPGEAAGVLGPALDGRAERGSQRRV